MFVNPVLHVCSHTIKELKYKYKTVNLLKGEQFSSDFSKFNPLNYVPVLVDEGEIVISNSFAILMYLEEKYHHQRPLLPQDLQKRIINFQAANIVSSSIQPLQNVSVLKYIEEKVSPDGNFVWAQKHIRKGFVALEKLLNGFAGRYATGNEVFLADLFLAPQIHGAITRFKIDMNQFPILFRLHQAYCELPAFQAAMSEKQPDFVET
ncbi:glutathione S-transferase zeta class-like [Telopea speciosissima]|uniref:glutathione S-transferase zeta class-like n=1 Tax=Telopea speciosissima TaxID=54955 RepID=UPI001CC6BD18|nr:glutathione S-transferase zeta class-like [Telopea speciosissima]